MSSLSDRSTAPIIPVAGLSAPPIVLPACVSAAEFAAALALTREMFGMEPEVEAMDNPEDPDHHWIDFAVICGGTTRSRIDQQHEWGRRMRRAVQDHLGRFTITIYPADEAR